jgi:hypothetical protein
MQSAIPVGDSLRIGCIFDGCSLECRRERNAILSRICDAASDRSCCPLSTAVDGIVSLEAELFATDRVRSVQFGSACIEIDCGGEICAFRFDGDSDVGSLDSSGESERTGARKEKRGFLFDSDRKWEGEKWIERGKNLVFELFILKNLRRSKRA